MQERRAGQGAREHFRRLLILWAAAAAFAFFIGVLVRTFADFKIPILWLAVGALLAPLIIDKTFEKDLFAWLGGARGEELVGKSLALLSADGFRVLHDVEAVGIGNIDHIVFGPTGAFAIETKAWNGSVYPGKGGRLICNGQDRHKHVRQAAREAVEVGNRLKRAGIDVWVQPVIVLTRAAVEKKTLVFDRVPVITLKQLPEFLRTARGRGLAAETTQRCVEAVLADPSLRIESTAASER